MMNYQAMPQPRRLRFTVDEYYKMFELGMLDDFEHSEIIEGELIQKMGIGDRHAFVVDTLNKIFIRQVSDDVLVRIQNPVRLSDYDEPEPDLALADLRMFDGRRHPRPKEVILLVEVSDSTVKYDRDKKLPMYAEAEIPEVWIVNLPNEIIEIHTQPNVGLYQIVKIFKRGETVKSDVLPELTVTVDTILG